MGNTQNCQFIGATLCPGCSGTSPLWINRALLAGRSLGGGGSFTYDGACYSIPANAQPQKPSGGGYASAGYIGETSPGCANCCAVKPESVFFDCSGTGTATVNVSGPPDSTVYLSWSSCYLVVNGVGPNIAGGSTSITLGSSGGTFTVGTSSSVCPIPCPGGPAGVNVGTSPGGDQCGSVAIYTGCMPCPETPTTLTAKITLPVSTLDSGGYGCHTINQASGSYTLQPASSGPGAASCGWAKSWAPTYNLPLVLEIQCVSGSASYPGTEAGQLYWQFSIGGSSPPAICYCSNGQTPPSKMQTLQLYTGYLKYEGPVPLGTCTLLDVPFGYDPAYPPCPGPGPATVAVSN